ncbi:pentapeptide repeat-containing protein [Nocardia sp. NPDC059228]
MHANLTRTKLVNANLIDTKLIGARLPDGAVPPQ